MHVEELKDGREWDDFLRVSPEGTFYHSLQWKEVLERTFHDAPLYLTVRDAGVIVGICPGFILSSMHTNIYSSMPYSDYGGPVIARHCIEQGSLLLRHYLQQHCSGAGVAYLNISFMDARVQRSFGSPSKYVDTSKGTVEIDLEATPSHLIWHSLFSRNRRKKIMRYEKEGYQAQQARTKSDLKEFYSLYCDNMEYVGARPYPYEFLESMWTLLYPLNLRIWLVGKEKAIGGMLVLKDAQRMYLFLAGIDRRQELPWWDPGVLNYLFWKEIGTAEEEGCRHISLGGTPSDPNDPYYLQKVSFGGSFNQQTVVCYPCSYIGWALLQAMAGAVSSWRTIKGLLPIRLRNRVRASLQEHFRD
ncbi:MAG: GNAT family N-acetyltransferase [Candidatus Bathyarchaeia archaeon]